jgi:hypothetical protein
MEPSIERILFWINEIRNHPEWLRQVTEKSKQQGRTPENQIYEEAKWAAEREMQDR